MKKIVQSFRTTMPFEHGLSPLTDKSRPSHLFGNTPSISDIINNNLGSFRNDIHSRNPNFGPDKERKDVEHHYRESGDEFMIEDKIMRSVNDLSKKNMEREVWVVETPSGSRIEYPNQESVQKDVHSGKIRVKRMFRTVRQAQAVRPDPNIERAESACFMVQTLMRDVGNVELGAAFCVKKNIFITCAHCVIKYSRKNPPVSFDNKNMVTLHHGEKVYNANVVAVNFYHDLAAIEADITCPILDLKTDEIFTGEDIFAVGSPKGFENNVTDGIISSVDRKLYYGKGAPTYLFTDALILPGNSGGPLISHETGKIVGIVQMIVAPEGVVGLNAALPASHIASFLKENGL